VAAEESRETHKIGIKRITAGASFHLPVCLRCMFQFSQIDKQASALVPPLSTSFPSPFLSLSTFLLATENEAHQRRGSCEKLRRLEEHFNARSPRRLNSKAKHKFIDPSTASFFCPSSSSP